MVRIIALLLLLAAPSMSDQALAADAAPPGALAPDGRLMLRRGDLVVIGLDPDLHIVVKSVEAVGPAGPLLREKPAADGTLTLYLGQDKDAGSFLRVENGSSMRLHYKADIVVPRDGKLDVVPTSICPVLPGASGLESWPNNVIGVVVGPFAKVDAEKTACAE